MPVNSELHKQRSSLVKTLESVLEGPMILLGFVWLILLIVELIWGLSPTLELMSTGIWIVFLIDFLIKLILSPKKIAFLKKNWLTIISLLIPALRIVRVFRVFRVLRGLRGLRLVKIVASINRGMRSLGATMRRRGVAYVLLLTIVVLFGGAAGMLAFEKEQGQLQNFWQSLWWTAMLIITIGSEYWPKTAEGKALCFLLALYGFAILGYLTATIASFFVGRDAEEEKAPIASAKDINALRNQVKELTNSINELKDSMVGKNI